MFWVEVFKKKEKRGVGYLCGFQLRPRSGLSLGFLFVYKLG